MRKHMKRKQKSFSVSCSSNISWARFGGVMQIAECWWMLWANESYLASVELYERILLSLIWSNVASPALVLSSIETLSEHHLSDWSCAAIVEYKDLDYLQMDASPSLFLWSFSWRGNLKRILIFTALRMVRWIQVRPACSLAVAMKVKLLDICNSFRKLRSPLANIARCSLTNMNIAEVCRICIAREEQAHCPLIAQNLLPPFNLTDDCNSRASPSQGRRE